ncbi:MAG: hypothetical protein JXQ90_02380 [Cyclobacteriaceae bacterium]
MIKQTLCILLCLFGSLGAMSRSEDMFQLVEYYVDTTNAMTVDQVALQQFSARENPNFGFNPNRIWLRLNIEEVKETGDFEYLVLGTDRSFSFESYEASDAQISKIPVLRLGTAQVIEMSQLQNSKYLFFSTLVLNMTMHAGVEAVTNRGALMASLGRRVVPYWMTMILLVLGFLIVFTHYLISKQTFYLVYSMGFGILGTYLAYHSGWLNVYLKSYEVMRVTFLMNLIYLFVWLPLMYISRLKNEVSLYKKLAIFSGLLILFNLALVYGGLGKEIDVVGVATEFIVFQISLIVLVLKTRTKIFEVNEKWFYYIYLLTLLTPILFALDNYGVYPDSWASRYSFELVVYLEVAMWMTYMGLSIRKSIGEKLRLEQIHMDLKKNVKYALIEGQERERHWFGKELHDNIGGTLSAIRLLIQTNSKAASPFLDQVSSDLMTISSNYISPDIVNESLQHELEKYISMVNQSGKVSIQLNIDSTKVLSFSSDQKLNAYRSIQEGINNAIKHGKATKIVIDIMDRPDDKLMIYIEDNGAGFKGPISEGIGLKSIRARFDRLEMDMSIGSEYGHGAYLEMVIAV